MQRHGPASRCICIVLWVAIALFFVLSGAAAVLFHAQARSPSDACGACLTQELRIMLNILAPGCAVALSGLGYFVSQGRARMWPVATAGILSAATITGFAIFGTWVFRELLPGKQLSQVVWWMF